MTCRSSQLMEKLDDLEFDSEIDSSYYDAAPCSNHQQADRVCCADRNGGGDGHDKCDGQSLSEKVLFNYLIFNKIMKYCDHSMLKSIRLVCLDWYQGSLEVWRKQSVLRIHDWDATPYSYSPLAHLSPSKFLQLTQCPPPNNILYWTQYPPQSLRLSKWNIMEPSVLRHPEEIWFWRKLSPSLTYLHLDSCTFGPKRFFDLLHKLDHLHHLKINGFERIDGGNDLMTTFGYPTNSSLKTIEIVGPIPFASWNFLQALPGLEAIILKGFSKDYLFDDLKRLRNKNGYGQFSLKTVDIIGTFQRLNGLVEANFSQLTHLTLQLNAELPEASFTRILEKYGENLQTLKLFRFPIASPEYKAFGGMPNVEFGKLQVLELWGNVIQNWNFLRRTPILESLKVNLQCFEKIRTIEYWRSRREKMIVFQNERVWDEDKGPFGVETGEDFKLEKMHTLEVDYKFGKKSMTILGKWMPNLQKLGTIMDSQDS